MSKDRKGDQLKQVEQVEAGRQLSNNLPLMVRLDGAAFSTYTRGLIKPYDIRLIDLMGKTTQHLISKTGATLGFCQSDEISLYWKTADTPGFEHLYGGKVQKITSKLAGIASAFFSCNAATIFPEKAKAYPHFDARAWNVDDTQAVFDNFVWRQQDCIRNSVSMCAQHQFSHKELQGVSTQELLRRLEATERPWDSEIPNFRYGMMFKRVTRDITLTSIELSKIPEKHRPTGPVTRSFVEQILIGQHLQSGDFNNLREIFE